MTDTEIIKALECCPQHIMCGHCPFRNVENCMSALYVDALDLINRQKAEVERLKAEAQMADGYADALEERAKSEAIKEFAERLKATLMPFPMHCMPDVFVVSADEIDNLVKEMVGE